MDSIESYLRKLIVASVGAADLGCSSASCSTSASRAAK